MIVLLARRTCGERCPYPLTSHDAQLHLQAEQLVSLQGAAAEVVQFIYQLAVQSVVYHGPHGE